MAKAERYFLRLPTPDGGEDYSLVDPSRLHIGVLNQIYQNHPAAGKGSERVRAFGVGPEVKMEFDASETLEKFREIAEQINFSLEEFGDAGKRVGGIINQIRLPDLIAALVAYDRDGVNRVVTEMMYNLQTTACELASELKTRGARLEQISTNVEQLAELVDGNAVNTDFYQTWALNGIYLSERVQALQVIEQGLKAHADAFTKIQERWVTETTSENRALRDALEYLNVGADDEEAFIDQAFAYRDEPSERGRMRSRLAVAERYVHAIREIERGVDVAWNELDRIMTAEVTPRQKDIDRLMGEFKGFRRVFQTHEESVSNGLPRPHTLAEPLMEEAQYLEAVEHATNEQWSPRTIQHRLSGLMSEISTLVADRPRLSLEVTRALEMAERAIDECRAVLGDSASAHDLPSVEAAGGEGETDAPIPHTRSTARLPSALADSKADELYELIICVFYVLTLKKPSFFAATTIRNALKVVAKLERCTVEEREQYYPRLHERSEREREYVKDSKQVMTRQLESRSRWVMGKYNNRHYLLKLTQRHEEEAIRLLTKHGLDEETIRGAFQALKEERRADYQARQSEE